MNKPMPSPTWDEYLAAAAAHLDEARRTSERGAPPSMPPERPDGPMPVECRSAAQSLAADYDALAEEVVARMSLIDQRRPPAVRLNAPRVQRPPRYIDTPI